MPKNISEKAFEYYLSSKQVSFRAINEESPRSYKNPDYEVYIDKELRMLCEVKEINNVMKPNKDLLKSIFERLEGKIKTASRQVEEFRQNEPSSRADLGVAILYTNVQKDTDWLGVILPSAFPPIYNETIRKFSLIAGFGLLMNDP